MLDNCSGPGLPDSNDFCPISEKLGWVEPFSLGFAVCAVTAANCRAGVWATVKGQLQGSEVIQAATLLHLLLLHSDECASMQHLLAHKEAWAFILMFLNSMRVPHYLLIDVV